MNNLRLLTGLFAVALSAVGAHAVAAEPQVTTLQQLFEVAEANSLRLRPSFSAET